MKCIQIIVTKQLSLQNEACFNLELVYVVHPVHLKDCWKRFLLGLKWDTCLVYLDDAIVAGKTFSDMLINLDRVLEKLGPAGLELKAKKCLCAKKVIFLGNIISEKGIATNPSKIKVVENYSSPSNATKIRSFFGTMQLVYAVCKNL